MEEEKAPQIENPKKTSIPDFKEYEIDRNGNVFRNGKLMKQQTNTYGYKHIHLCIGGKVTTCLVHRLVAMAFIPNPDGKPCVDHIDGNRKNNSVDNLRWVTIKENNNNPITKERIGLSKSGENCPFYGKRGKCCLHSKPLFQFKNGELIGYFESIDEACKKYGYDHSLITRCCQHKVSIAYGYEWEYAFDYFIELTKQLRHNQRRYFAQRRPEILETCKRLEGEVDAIVAKITDKQMRLF